MKTKIFSKIRVLISSYLVLGLILFPGVLQVAHAADLTNTYDTMTRLSINAASDHAIQFRTPTGVATTETIVVTFPSDFDGANDPQGALDETDVDLLEDTTPDSVCDGTAETLVASTPSTSEWTAVFSGTENRTLTFTSGGSSALIGAASEVCIKIGENATGGTSNSQYINTSTNGSKVITLAAGSGADTGNVTVNILSDDQVAVTATVAQALSFSISDNTVEFGTLTAADDFYADNSGGNATETAAHTLVVGTNASNGYTMTVNGSTLTSGSNTIDAIGSSNTASSTGTEQFGLRMTSSGGSGAVSAPYAASGFALDTAAFPDAVATSTTASDDTTYSVRYLANIGSATEAGSYTATLTYVTTANF